MTTMDMNEQNPELDQAPETAEPPKPPGVPTASELPRGAPIESRFLFVDVAAQRAKQLRRGALPRLPQYRPDPLTGLGPDTPVKLERVAMDEVQAGLIIYELPEPKPRRPEEAK